MVKKSYYFYYKTFILKTVLETGTNHLRNFIISYLLQKRTPRPKDHSKIIKMVLFRVKNGIMALGFNTILSIM